MKREGSERLNVGFIGYPNVGKSSTINSLVGGKAVATSAQPGKTKHIQTIDIGSGLRLLDCPGVVFPTCVRVPKVSSLAPCAVARAEMVVNGILSIDNMTTV